MNAYYIGESSENYGSARIGQSAWRYNKMANEQYSVVSMTYLYMYPWQKSGYFRWRLKRNSE